MACATLKRHHCFDLIHSNCSKRKRFEDPFHSSFSADANATPSPFACSVPTTQAQLKRRIKEEIKRMQRRRLIPRFLGGPAHTVPTTFTSHVQEESSAVASCSGSFRSMVLRSPNQDSQDSDSDTCTVKTIEPSSSSLQPKDPASQLPSSTSICSRPIRSLDSVPIFTLSQVTTLCERLVKEREEEIRQEFETILSCKLAEQYEAFLKFSHDQLYSRFQSAPMSYVS